jgi:hypothetical protein
MLMARPSLVIHPEITESAGLISYKFDLAYSNGSRGNSLFYEVIRQPGTKAVDICDGILCATILHAMREGLDVRLRGTATEAILKNLKEFQLAWARWLPDTYQPVEIHADAILDQTPRTPSRAIAAFSGGVDSLFTMLRHNLEPSVPPHRVDGALMVHGFDVFLKNTADFAELVERTAEIRETMGVSLRVVRTNSKELRLQTWAHSFAAELAACMHFCSAEFSEGLIGSSEPYDALVLPWGSNPVTDHLLSGGALKITHDGAGFSRTDKVAYLSGFPTAMRALKVCWEGARQARNCGVCEKCIRTQLNFLASGVADPPCFDSPLDLRRITSVAIPNDILLAEFRSICEYAERRGVEGEWLRLLRARVRRGTGDRTWKGLAKACLAKVGLLDSARKLRSRSTPETAQNGHVP